MGRTLKAGLIAATLSAALLTPPAAMSDPGRINFFRDYYISVKRATGGDPTTGLLSILQGIDRDRGKTLIAVDHPCVPRGHFQSPVFWRNGNHFVYKWVRGERRIMVRGVFRDDYVKGVYKFANTRTDCGTGSVGFKRRKWSPPAQ